MFLVETGKYQYGVGARPTNEPYTRAIESIRLFLLVSAAQ